MLSGYKYLGWGAQFCRLIVLDQGAPPVNLFKYCHFIKLNIHWSIWLKSSSEMKSSTWDPWVGGYRIKSNEPHHAKTCLGLRQAETQTGLLGYISIYGQSLEITGKATRYYTIWAVLIRLCRWASWSAPLLFTYCIAQMPYSLLYPSPEFCPIREAINLWNYIVVFLWLSSLSIFCSWTISRCPSTVPDFNMFCFFFVAGHKLLCCLNCSIHANQNKKEK